MVKRGKIILIEGTDGSGKKTQSLRLKDRLNEGGFPVERMAFPRYHTPTGRIIGQCYLGKKGRAEEGDVAWFGNADEVDPRIASMFYAADRYAAVPMIEAIIGSGTHLILDRYVESNMGHQGGKETNPRKRQDIIRFISDLEYGLLQLPSPDLTIFLYMPPEVSMELANKRGEETDGHEGNFEHLKRAEETYLQLADEKGWKRVDCVGATGELRTREEVGEEVYHHVIQFLRG